MARADGTSGAGHAMTGSRCVYPGAGSRRQGMVEPVKSQDEPIGGDALPPEQVDGRPASDQRHPEDDDGCDSGRLGRRGPTRQTARRCPVRLGVAFRLNTGLRLSGSLRRQSGWARGTPFQAGDGVDAATSATDDNTGSVRARARPPDQR